MNDTVSTLASLVAFPSICGTPNAPIMDWIEQRLAALGAHIHRVPGYDEGRSSLFASVGPDIEGGIVLSAHADVVPVAGQPWTSDPFTLTERDGRLYGRGSSDMKGFIACMLTAAARAATQPLIRPLHLAISHDEELGCVGVRSLLDFLRHEGMGAQGCVVGEPTGMEVAVAHKGKVALRLTCHGRAAHSANPLRGINAIVLAAGMVDALQALQKHIASTEPHDPRFDVPFSTVQTGLISGGTALNIVPDRCEIMAEIRLLPGISPQPYIAWLHEAGQRLTRDGSHGRIEIDITNAYPGLADDPGSEFLSLGLRHARSNTTRVIDFGTEAGLFRNELGLPCIICGPGDIGRAHKADEYVTRAELAEGDRFLAELVNGLCRPGYSAAGGSMPGM